MSEEQRIRERLNAEYEQQKEAQAHGAGMETGHREAGTATIDFGGRDEDLIEQVFSPDLGIDDEDLPPGVVDDLEAMFSAEFGRHIGLANISRERWEEERHMDRARAMMAKGEFRIEGRSGSKCTGEFRDIITDGDGSDRELLTDEYDRKIDAAFEERSMLRSLSIEGRGFRGITEAIVWSVTEGYDTDGDGDGGGLLSSTVGRVIP